MVTIDEWGQDHWSTLAYLETVQVDEHGVINRLKMRCDPELHPELCHYGMGSARYPTKLKGGKCLSGHDDWSCVEDMEAIGLLSITWVTDVLARVKFTDRGWEIAHRLRRYRAEGGKYRDFRPDKP